MKTYEELLAPYPALISKEQFYQICHISKRTALQLFQANLIPVIDTKKQTRRYFIAKEDVLVYLHQRDLHPERYRFSRKSWVQTYHAKTIFTKEFSVAMMASATVRWQAEQDVLLVQDLVKLLGYADKTIRKWVTCGFLSSIRVQGNLYIPKIFATQFVGSPEFHSIPRKSLIHLSMIKEASV